MFSTPLVNLYTRDIEAGLRFYRDLLGFTETFRTPREQQPQRPAPRPGRQSGGDRRQAILS